MHPRNVTNWSTVPVLVDVPFAMRILGCSQNTIYKMVRSGQLPALPRVSGGAIRIPKESLMVQVGAIS